MIMKSLTWFFFRLPTYQIRKSFLYLLKNKSFTLKVSAHILVILLMSPFFNFISAQPVISTDDDPPCYAIEARVRNGNAGFEAALFSPSTPPPGQPGGEQWQLNPSGAPIWNTNGNQYGDLHTFQFIYTKATGTSVWNIDFNRDGDFSDPSESVTNVAPTLAGKGFKYVNLWGQGHSSGLTAHVTDFTVNGINFGTFSSSSETPFSTLFEETYGLFNDVTITANFSFSGNGNQERPRIWVRLGTENEAPVCSIVSPLSNAIFNVIDSILIETSVSDDGIIMVVEFFDGTTKIGEDSVAPYEFIWIGPSVGAHALTIKATDSYDAFTVSAPVNININAPPVCNLISPADGFVYFEPDSLYLEATASDLDDSVIVVQFYINSILMSSDSTSPYTFTFNNPPDDNYVLTAKAIDARNGMTVSMPITGIVNAPPTCSIINPTDGQIFYDPNTIPFVVSATDATDSVRYVEFFLDGVPLGVDSFLPYESNAMVNTPMGMYTLTAKAEDIYGVITYSLPIDIVVRCIREDLDQNGIVNTSDYLLLLSAFGSFCTGCNEDFNDDGAVNTIDFLRLLTKIGHTCN